MARSRINCGMKPWDDFIVPIWYTLLRFNMRWNDYYSGYKVKIWLFWFRIDGSKAC